MKFIPILLFIIIPPLIAADIYVRFRPYDTTEHSNSAAAHTHLTTTYHPQRSYTQTPNLHHYSATQLQNYFAHHGYSEKKILSQYDLYTSDEFIKVVKTYPGYEQAIASQHKTCRKIGWLGKWIYSLTGFYSAQRAQRIQSLYNKIHNTGATSQHIGTPVACQAQKQFYNCNYHQSASQNQIIHALEQSACLEDIATEIHHIAQTTLRNIEKDSYIDARIEDAIDTSIATIKTANSPAACIFHAAFVDHVLADLENQTTSYSTNQQPSFIERSPALLTRALKTFVKGLNPITQVTNACEFIISTAHFAADVTVGKLYLSEQQYNERIENFWSTCNALSPSNLAQLEAGQWVDLAAQVAADCVFFGGVSRTVAYLKEIGAVSQTQIQVRHIAQKLKNAVDGSLAEKPLVVTAEGVAFRATDEMKLFGGAAKEVIQDSRALLESASKGLLADFEKEMTHLRVTFDNKVKGFLECSNKYLKPDYMHILGMELNFCKKGRLTIGGLHHDFLQSVERSDIFKFANKIMYESDFYSADLFYNGAHIKYATFFPSHWTREQVINSIYEAYQNFIQSGMKPILKPDGKYEITALTNEQIKIRMYISKNGSIKTAYPILKKEP